MDGPGFRDGLDPEMGVHFRVYSCPKMAFGYLDLDRDGFPQVVGGNKRWDKPKTVVQPASICQANNRRCTAVCCTTPPTRARLRHHHELMGSDCDGVDYGKSLATLLAVGYSAFSKRNHYLSRRGRGQRVVAVSDIDVD